MQSFLVVNDRPIGGLQGGFIDVGDRGDDSTDAGLLQACVGASTHAACQQHLAISDRAAMRPWVSREAASKP